VAGERVAGSVTTDYLLTVTREDPWWVARISAAPAGQDWLVGRATDARTLGRLESSVRDMLGLLLDDDDTDGFELSWHYELPPALAGPVEDALDARERFRAAEKALAPTGRAAARALTGAGISRRDAAVVLGLSFQRVAQLATETEDPPAPGHRGAGTRSRRRPSSATRRKLDTIADAS